MTFGQECGNDAGAYVLGAMDGAELSAFERHLATCDSCREEVDLLQGAVDALPLMVSQVAVPSTLRKRVMSDVRADAVARRAAASRGIGYEARERTGAAPMRRWLARPVPRPAMAGIGALLLAAVVTIAISSRPGGSHYVPAQTAYAGTEAALRVDGNHGELLVKGMPAPPAGKIYEVWLQRGNHTPQPTEALFDPTSAGEAAVDVPGSLDGVTRVMVTAERAGGSTTPHGPVLIAAKLA